jgi:hypothetical protein
VLTDEVVELYRRAQPLWNARYGKSLTDEELATVQAFDRAAGRKPWEHSLLSPRSDDDPLRSALLAKVSDVEAEAWRRDARKVQRRCDAEMAKGAREHDRRVKAAQQRLAGG